ncbi:MAG: POTRA domain-containing protein, partial [Calditrichota bacterium]
MLTRLFPVTGLLLLLIASSLFAQDELQIIRVDDIQILGNKKTQDAVILRELHITPPCDVELTDLEQIQNRLSNLFIFNRVQVGVLEVENRNILQIEVTETWYLYPV